MIINPTQIHGVIEDAFRRRFTSDFYLMISDEQYYCPTMDEVKEIIKKNTIDRIQYTDEVFDCDDYALALKYHFIKQAYTDKHRKHPYCMGMVMGNILEDIPHAINFVITNTLELFLIEPQTDEILQPTKLDREIYFMYM